MSESSNAASQDLTEPSEPRVDFDLAEQCRYIIPV